MSPQTLELRYALALQSLVPHTCRSWSRAYFSVSPVSGRGRKDRSSPSTYLSPLAPRYLRGRAVAHTCRSRPRAHLSFSFSFSSRWRRSDRKGPYALRPVSQQSPQGCPRNSANICLVEHRSFSAVEGGTSAASFLHSSFTPECVACLRRVGGSTGPHPAPTSHPWLLGTYDWLVVCCLTSQQQASVSQGRICSDNCTCCHTEIEVADPTFYLTQSQYTDTGPTSPTADPITPGAWQGSHWSANF